MTCITLAMEPSWTEHQLLCFHSQTSRGVPRQSPPWAPSLIHMFSGDAELDQVQIHDWDKEVKEDEAAIAEEELARVQQKIERLQ
jgi:hypothetical protein